MTKVLLCGQVCGAAQWRTVLERAQKLNAAAAKSGTPPFELLLSVGSSALPQLEELPGGRAPLPTYVISASAQSQPQVLATAPEQVAENFFLLRGVGVVTVRSSAAHLGRSAE